MNPLDEARDDDLLDSLHLRLSAEHEVDAGSLAVAEFVHCCRHPSTPLASLIRRVAVAQRGTEFEVWINLDAPDDATFVELETILNY